MPSAMPAPPARSRLARAAAVVATGAAGALVAGLLVAPGPASAATASAERTRSPYALKATGFGTRLVGSQVPAGSDPSAFAVIACSTRAGTAHENHEAETKLPGAGRASGIKTKLWTVKRGGSFHSYARNTTANVVLAQSGLGTLQISAIRSFSHSWHDARGFHAATSTSVGRLELVPPTGDPQVLDLPTPGQPVTVPGLATVRVGNSSKKVRADGASAWADALNVRIIPTGSRLTVGHTVARALAGVEHGTFHGSSSGTRVSAADDNITVGRTPLEIMPCQGSGGKLLHRSIAHADLGDQIIVHGLRAEQKGTPRAHRSIAMERGTVAELNIGGGQLVISGVVGQANVTRLASGKLRRSAKGTTVGTITANGKPQSFPDTGPLEIPGVAKVWPRKVEKIKGGISVVAVRVTLLDGTGAVIDLGVAKARISKRR